MRGRRPRAPEIYRFNARMARSGRSAPSRHSGRWVGALVASLRCHVLRPGAVSISSSGLPCEESLLEKPPARYNYSCSGSALLAGFEVTLIGRFSGDHRGPATLYAVRDPLSLCGHGATGSAHLWHEYQSGPYFRSCADLGALGRMVDLLGRPNPRYVGCDPRV